MAPQIKPKCTIRLKKSIYPVRLQNSHGKPYFDTRH